MAEDKKPVELNEREGKLFVNNDKTEDWHGDYTGQILLPDGTRCYINLWQNVGRNSGNTWFKVKVGNPVKSSANTEPQAPVQNTQPAGQVMDVEDEMPF